MGVQLPPDSTGKIIKTSQPGGGDHCEHIILQGAGAAAEIVVVSNGNPNVTDYALVVRQAGKTIKTFNVQPAASGDNTVVASVVGKRIKVIEFSVQNQSANSTNVKWKSGASTDLRGPLALDSHESWGRNGQIQSPVLQTVAGEALVLNLSGANIHQVDGTYYDDDAS